MNTCWSSSTPELIKKKGETPSRMDERDWKLENHLFLTQLLPVLEQEEL